MILKINQPAPDFTTRDIYGNNLQLSNYKGRKVLLTFYRHVACPVNNLRFLELNKYGELFREKKLAVLAVYESTRENLLKYSAKEGYYATLIANPEFNLYQTYEIELNFSKLLYSMYKGVHAKKIEGERLAKHKFDPEGHSELLGGDFLIGEDGALIDIYYNQYLGDHLPVENILSFINDPLYKPKYQLVCCK